MISVAAWPLVAIIIIILLFFLLAFFVQALENDEHSCYMFKQR